MQFPYVSHTSMGSSHGHEAQNVWNLHTFCIDLGGQKSPTADCRLPAAGGSAEKDLHLALSMEHRMCGISISLVPVTGKQPWA